MQTKTTAKSIEELTSDDLDRHPIWAFVNSDKNELFVKPISRVPVRNLMGKVVGTKARLACGRYVQALLGNIDLSNPRFTTHFLTVSIERDGRWFHLARYHDHDRDVRGPDALARFLELGTSDIFPITYDLRPYADGELGAVLGVILAEPSEKLSRAQIIALAVP